MLEQSDVPLKQKQGNMLNPAELKNNANYNQKIRKIKFDRGIPMSFEFMDNAVKTFDYKIYDAEHRVFITATWADIRVGHIIRVNKNEIVPADIILLETMDSNHLCYVDVSAITGIFDKFLIKKACTDTQTPTIKQIKFSEYVKNVKGMLKFEDQDDNINSFAGRLKLESFPRATDVNDENFVMRGSTIKNVKWIYGLVVYTGMETKILRAFKFQNFRSNRNGNSNSSLGININKENRSLLYNSLLFTQYFMIGFYVVIVLILMLSHLNKSFVLDSRIKDSLNSTTTVHKDRMLLDFGNGNNLENMEKQSLNITRILSDIGPVNKLLDTNKPYEEFVVSFLQFLFTFLLIIPYNWFSFVLIAYYILSLYVSWDIKIIQKSKYTVDVINSDCLSDFGQVKYILADKTGTLTSRKFVLKACSIKGRIFSFESHNATEEANIFKNNDDDYSDLEIYQELKKSTVLSKYIREFFEYLCVCNTVKLSTKERAPNSNFNPGVNSNANNYNSENLNLVGNKQQNNNFFSNDHNANNVNNNTNNNNNNNKENYNQYGNAEKVLGASFAEDISLMKVLKHFGYQILKTKADKTEIEADNFLKTYSIVGRNKYSTERQRMSMIVKKSKTETESILICKGYDLSIFDLINENEDSQLKLVIEQIKRLTQIGYRFIVVCKKELNEEDTLNFITRYKSAENYIFQREIHFEELAYDYEYELELLGVLFFEEKISADLRYTISKLNNFNIKTWIVSGDSKENVLAAGRNLDMYKSNALVCEFSEFDDEDDLDIKMNLFLSQFFSSGEDNEKVTMKTMNTRKGLKINVDTSSNKIKTKGKEFTILIHGECFQLICNDVRFYQCFAALLSYTTSLFAYSFSPQNKFMLCRTVKNFLTRISNSKVLAVGDGLNDFMMLKEADLSIGIRSKEILQVRNTCDIIVSRFSQITDLVLVHGTWNYDRIVKIIFFSAYANIVIIFPFFLHQGANRDAAVFLGVNYLKLNLDIVLIDLAIVIIFCLNMNIERALIGLNQTVYFENFKQGKNLLMKFGKIVLFAIVDSSLIYFFSCEMLRTSVNLIGQNLDDSMLGSFINYACYILILVKLFFIEISLLNSFILITLMLLVGGIIGFTFIDVNTNITIFQSLSHLSILLAMIVIISICFFYQSFFVYYNALFRPMFIQLITRKFQKYVEDYILFIKFDEILREIHFLNSTRGRTNNNNVVFKDVLQSVHDQFKGLNPVLDNLIDINNDELTKMKIDHNHLKFRDDVVETDYRIDHSPIMHNSFLFYFFSQLVFWIVDVVIESSQNRLEEDKISKILKMVMILSTLIFFWKPVRINFPVYFKYYFYLNIAVDVLLLYIEKGNNNIKLCFLFIFSFTFPLTISSYYFNTIVCGTILYLISCIPAIYLENSKFIAWTVFKNQTEIIESNTPSHETNLITNPIEYKVSSLPILYHKTLLIFGNLFIMLIFGYAEEFFTRINYLKYYKKFNDMKKNNEIYSNLVPEFVREKMKNGIRGAAIDFEIVTILFCDISDFDKFVASMSPKELIQLLDRIYNTFDQLCNLHGLQKIETVGKTYMAAAGLKECEKDVDPILLKKHQAVRTFELSLDMIDTIEKIILENGETVKIKIGVHTGKILAAVVGNHKPQFSLIGDAVNTTARMCAYSSDMCVLCSESAWENINKDYSDFQHSVKEVKGKGSMNIYLYNPNKPKGEKMDLNNVRDKRRMTETKFMNNLNLNFGAGAIGNLNNRKAYNKKQTINKENPGAGNKKGKQMQRQNSVYSNQSNFIMENSFENNSEIQNNKNINNNNSPNNHMMMAVEKQKPKSLSRLVTHKEQDNQFGSINGIVKNYMWDKSFFFLKFYDQQSYDLFNSFSKYKFLKSVNRAILFNYTYSVIMLIAIYNTSEYNHIDADRNYNNIFTVFKVIVIFLIMLFSHLSPTLVFNQNRPKLIKFIFWTLYLFMTILILAQTNFLINETFSLNLSLEQNLTTLLVSCNGFFGYSTIFYNLILYIIFFCINIAVNNSSIVLIKYNVYMIMVCFVIYMFILIRFYIATLDYLKNLNESENLKTIENLLFNLMPQHVVLNLKEDIPVADVLEDVTMLFADIVKFTDYSSEREPAEVVMMLSELFKQFDDSCKDLNCYKVHTIGDCYVVMSFTGRTPLNERNFKEEAKNVVKMGESMIEIIKKVRESVNFHQLNMRIGIHTGTVIAGIVGTKVVRYDIFGSDVLIANKMESNGEVGKIAVSEDTKNLLEYEDGVNKDNYFKFIPNKTVHVGSVNREIKSYFITTNLEN